MANPTYPGGLEIWLSAAQPLRVQSPRSGNTGGLESWISATRPIPAYVSAPAITFAPLTSANTDITWRVLIDWDRDGFNNGAFDDISGFVKNVHISLGNTGNPTDLTAFVGQCSITLRNDSRLFSPANASGRYYTKLVPGVPIQVNVQDKNTLQTWQVFNGVTRTFTATPSTTGSQEAQIDCIDYVGILQDTTINLPLLENLSSDVVIKHIVNNAFNAPPAIGWLIFTSNPANNDTVTVNTQTYLFKTTLTGALNEVLIGATALQSGLNFAAAINKASGAGAAYSANIGDSQTTALTTATYTITPSSTGGSTLVIGNSGGTNYEIGQSFTVTATGALTSFTFYLGANVGSPTGAMYYAIRNDAGGQPDMSGPLVRFGVFTPTPSAANTISLTFPNAPLLTIGKTYWLHLYPGATQTSGNYWTLDRSAGSTYSGGALYYRTNGTWGASLGVQMRGSFTFSTTMSLTATIRGAVGNGYALSYTSAALLSSGGFTGGVDYPAGKFSYQTGVNTLSVAGDRWSNDTTNALTAIQQVTTSEQGRFWAARNGTITFLNRDYVFLKTTAGVQATIADKPQSWDAQVSEDTLFNNILVKYNPRSLLTTGIIAKSQQTITVPGQTGLTERYNPTQPLTVAAGDVNVKLPFIDPATGLPCGGKSIQVPLTPSTDWTANEAIDGTGVDYTGSARLTFSLAMNGSNCEIAIKNTALGPLYITKLQVRGSALVMYNPTLIAKEDRGSWILYGKRSMTLDLPLPSTIQFADALGDYILNRYRNPAYRLKRIGFQKLTHAGGVNLYGLELGDALILSEAQTGITTRRYLIIGAEYDLSPASAGDISFALYELDDTTYAIYDNAVVGLYDSPYANYSL